MFHGELPHLKRVSKDFWDFSGTSGRGQISFSQQAQWCPVGVNLSSHSVKM